MVVDDSVFWSAYALAARVVGTPEVRDGWMADSAVAGYTVGGLVAHLVVATARTAEVLEGDVAASAGLRVVGLAEFYGVNRIENAADRTAGLHAYLVADGAQRAVAGADALVSSFHAIEPRLRPLLAEADADRLVPVVQVRDGATRLDDYLVTRVVELVVHADDVAVSVGLPDLVPPPEVVLTLTGAFSDLAVARSGPMPVVRAFVRRERADGDVLRVL